MDWETTMKLIKAESEKWIDKEDVLETNPTTKKIKSALLKELPKAIPELIADEVIDNILEVTRTAMKVGFFKGLEVVTDCLDKKEQ